MLLAGLAMFEAIRYDAKSERLNVSLGLFASLSIGENLGWIDDFRDPTVIFLLFDFHSEIHRNETYPFRRRLKSVQDVASHFLPLTELLRGANS